MLFFHEIHLDRHGGMFFSFGYFLFKSMLFKVSKEINPNNIYTKRLLNYSSDCFASFTCLENCKRCKTNVEGFTTQETNFKHSL